MKLVEAPERITDNATAEAILGPLSGRHCASHVDLFVEKFPQAPRATRAIDLCCGSGEITLGFAEAFPHWEIDGVDRSALDLVSASRAASRLPEHRRPRFQNLHVPSELERGKYGVVLSVGSLHHFRRPELFWQAVKKCADSGALVFVTDLLRPASQSDAAGLVQRYEREAPPLLKDDYFNTLLGSFSLEEVESQLVAAELPGLKAERIDDRHQMVWGRVG